MVCICEGRGLNSCRHRESGGLNDTGSLLPFPTTLNSSPTGQRGAPFRDRAQALREEGSRAGGKQATCGPLFAKTFTTAIIHDY